MLADVECSGPRGLKKHNQLTTPTPTNKQENIKKIAHCLEIFGGRRRRVLDRRGPL